MEKGNVIPNNGVVNTELKVKDDIGNEFIFNNNIVRTSGNNNRCLLNAFFGAAILERDRNDGIENVTVFDGDRSREESQFALSHYSDKMQLLIIKNVLFFGKESPEYKKFELMFIENLKYVQENNKFTIPELMNYYDMLLGDCDKNDKITFDTQNKEFYKNNKQLFTKKTKTLYNLDEENIFKKIIEERKTNVIYTTIFGYMVEQMIELSNKNKIKQLFGHEVAIALNNILSGCTDSSMLDATSAGALLSYLSGKKINIFSYSKYDHKMSVTHFEKGEQKIQHEQIKFTIEKQKICGPNGQEMTIDYFIKYIKKNEKTCFFKMSKYHYNRIEPFENLKPINPDNLIEYIEKNSNEKFMIEMSPNTFALPANKNLFTDENTVNLLYGYGASLNSSQHYQILTKAPQVKLASQVDYIDTFNSSIKDINKNPALSNDTNLLLNNQDSKGAMEKQKDSKRLLNILNIETKTTHNNKKNQEEKKTDNLKELKKINQEGQNKTENNLKKLQTNNKSEENKTISQLSSPQNKEEKQNEKKNNLIEHEETQNNKIDMNNLNDTTNHKNIQEIQETNVKSRKETDISKEIIKKMSNILSKAIQQTQKTILLKTIENVKNTQKLNNKKFKAKLIKDENFMTQLLEYKYFIKQLLEDRNFIKHVISFAQENDGLGKADLEEWAKYIGENEKNENHQNYAERKYFVIAQELSYQYKIAATKHEESSDITEYPNSKNLQNENLQNEKVEQRLYKIPKQCINDIVDEMNLKSHIDSKNIQII